MSATQVRKRRWAATTPPHHAAPLRYRYLKGKSWVKVGRCFVQAAKRIHTRNRARQERGERGLHRPLQNRRQDRQTVSQSLQKRKRGRQRGLGARKRERKKRDNAREKKRKRQKKKDQRKKTEEISHPHPTSIKRPITNAQTTTHATPTQPLAPQ
ncbi:uncharacterized protein K452DRAFT_56637 [Aplosporella prunicola CBS 121167]|uniref:Uncharacterized protein n=1 Tax=Aplosporella prunicola CBS 121167 TaxID=1176127 RepID=A0A6A6B905_9PEZI|nr:uncharacterized protein K452DRAFT_56637 [Aplosporella prunicola CBS 121167]KAF2139843.1 hypothetical protein K452DRAFT_56637 [Aplosporella prunicola CBS 121167]